jgi:type I restriction enzyme S subunit
MVNMYDQIKDTSDVNLPDSSHFGNEDKTGPAGFKQTEIGPVPEDWTLSTMANITNLMTNGFVGTAKSHYTDSHNGVVYIQGYNVEENGINYHGIKRVTPEFHKKNSKSCLKTGDMLMVQTGEVGLVTIVPRELEGANCHALIINRFKPAYEPKYFVYLFNSEYGRQKLKELETGTTMKHINVGDLLHFVVPFPKLKKEQIAIANALSDVDALIDSLEALVAKKQAIKTATMQQLLTGRTRLPQFARHPDGTLKGTKHSELGEIPEDWEVRRLGEFGSVIRGVSYRGDSDLESNDSASNKRLLRSNNVQNSHVDISNFQIVNERAVSNQQLLKSDDILICMANGSKSLVGKAGLFDVNDGFYYTFGAFMGCFRANKEGEPGYIFSQFLTSRYRKYIANLLAGSSINNLKPSDIESMDFAFPCFAEQESISNILFDMYSEVRELEQRLAKIRQLKQGMMQELLTGRTRLVESSAVSA